MAKAQPTRSPASSSGRIRLCCGHVVDRANKAPTQGYWCEECGRARMSGAVGTGERVNAWAEQLRDDVENSPIPIVVDDPGTEHGRALVLALGAEIQGPAEL
jgi:hypothetical protein